MASPFGRFQRPFRYSEKKHLVNGKECCLPGRNCDFVGISAID
ncbi:conserved hypothetical protein [delta proteobacterium NaphS2]|nr:conserved hypothetical protein [delta proteobacterium NaphS2]